MKNRPPLGVQFPAQVPEDVLRALGSIQGSVATTTVSQGDPHGFSQEIAAAQMEDIL